MQIAGDCAGHAPTWLDEVDVLLAAEAADIEQQWARGLVFAHPAAHLDLGRLIACREHAHVERWEACARYGEVVGRCGEIVWEIVWKVVWEIWGDCAHVGFVKDGREDVRVDPLAPHVDILAAEGV